MLGKSVKICLLELIWKLIFNARGMSVLQVNVKVSAVLTKLQ